MEIIFETHMDKMIPGKKSSAAVVSCAMDCPCADVNKFDTTCPMLKMSKAFGEHSSCGYHRPMSKTIKIYFMPENLTKQDEAGSNTDIPQKAFETMLYICKYICPNRTR